MKIVENDAFKINLIDDLNKQRLSGINCDIEIDSERNTSKIYTHSIIVNVFSDIFSSAIVVKRNKVESYHKLKFPDDLMFLQSDCFDCFNQVIHYFYIGELNVHPEHEEHVRNIVLNLRIGRLVQFFTDTYRTDNSSYYEYKNPDLNTEHKICHSHTNIDKHQNTSSEEFRNEHLLERDKNEITINETINKAQNVNDLFIRSDQKLMRDSLMLAKEELNKNPSVPNQTINHLDKSVERYSEEPIHSDGLHLLLSILEGENKNQFLLPNSNLIRRSKDHVLTNEMRSSHQTCEASQVLSCEDRNPKEGQDLMSCKIARADNVTPHLENQCKTDYIEDGNVSHEQVSHVVLQSETQYNRQNMTETVEANVKRKRRKMMKRDENCKRKKKEERDTAEQDGYMCKKCKTFFDNLTLFQEHLQSTHSKKFKCIACQFVTYKIRGFIDHLIQNRHEGTICSICHFQTSTNDELIKHIARHKQSLPRPFFCNDCEKTFPTRRSWSVHLPVHSHESQFLCAVCSKSFKWAQGLENHMSTHANEKLYLCDQCDFLTASRAYLAKHALKHESKKQVCPYEECKHREIWKENFKAHLLTHSKEKRFQCELCGNSFAQARNLDRHLESVHNPNRLQHLVSCNQCAYSTIRLDKLKDHFKSRHKGYDYTQYMGKLKEEMKVKVAQGVRVRDFIKPNEKPANFMNQIENRTPTKVLGPKAGLLAVPVLGRDVSSADRKTQILMNVNKIGGAKIVGSRLDKKTAGVRSVFKDRQTSKTKSDKDKLKLKNKSDKDKQMLEKNDPNRLKSKGTISFQENSKTKVTRSMNNIKVLRKYEGNSPNNKRNVTQENVRSLCLIQPKPASTNLATPLMNHGPIILIVTNAPRPISKINEVAANVASDKLLPVQTDMNVLLNGNLKSTVDTLLPLVTGGSSSIMSSNGNLGDEQEAQFVKAQSMDGNGMCLSSEVTCGSDGKCENFSGPSTASLDNTAVPVATAAPHVSTSSFPKELVDGNYFDVLDESTGELHLLTSKHINNPFLDEATGELSVFEIPSSFVNYIEKLTSAETDQFDDYDILDPQSWNLQL